MKYLAFFCTVTIFTLFYQLIKQGDTPVDDYQSIFVKEVPNLDTYRSYYDAFNGKVLIAPAQINESTSGVSNIRSEWLKEYLAEPSRFKQKLEKMVERHANTSESKLGLSVQNIALTNVSIYFCIIHDPNNLIDSLDDLYEEDPFAYFLVHHEFEHCSINGYKMPFYTEQRFLQHWPKNISKDNYQKYSQIYSLYLQEMYADIVTLITLLKKSPVFDFQSEVSINRKIGADKGDFLHDSRMFVESFFKSDNREIEGPHYRERVFSFVKENAFNLMPLEKFIAKIENPNTQLGYYEF